jgi:hypothetical protein
MPRRHRATICGGGGHARRRSFIRSVGPRGFRRLARRDSRHSVQPSCPQRTRRRSATSNPLGPPLSDRRRALTATFGQRAAPGYSQAPAQTRLEPLRSVNPTLRLPRSHDHFRFRPPTPVSWRSLWRPTGRRGRTEDDDRSGRSRDASVVVCARVRRCGPPRKQS